MKKVLFLLLALMPLSSFVMDAEEEKTRLQIPLQNQPSTKLNRSISSNSIVSYCCRDVGVIVTQLLSDVGNVELSVINLVTGEIWSTMMDSSCESQNIIEISVSQGVYQVTYVTELDGVYYGVFAIE